MKWLKYWNLGAKNWKVAFFSGKSSQTSYSNNRRHNLTNISLRPIKNQLSSFLSFLFFFGLITVNISILTLFYLSWYLRFQSRLYYTLILQSRNSSKNLTASKNVFVFVMLISLIFYSLLLICINFLFSVLIIVANIVSLTF